MDFFLTSFLLSIKMSLLPVDDVYVYGQVYQTKITLIILAITTQWSLFTSEVGFILFVGSGYSCLCQCGVICEGRHLFDSANQRSCIELNFLSLTKLVYPSKNTSPHWYIIIIIIFLKLTQVIANSDGINLL